MTYVFAFDLEFCSLLLNDNPTNLVTTYCTSLGVQEFLDVEKEHSNGSLACDQGSGIEEDEDDSHFDDHEPIVALLKPYAEFHEDEDEDE